MFKLDAIKKVYGEYFSKCKPDENGWTTYDSWFKYIGNKIDYDYSDNRIMNVRPKLLSGIENNNGWVKIESGKDIPTDSSVFYKYCIDGVPHNINCNLANLKMNIRYYEEKVTHYKIDYIEKPPLY